jgi:hypothetical protein
VLPRSLLVLGVLLLTCGAGGLEHGLHGPERQGLVDHLLQLAAHEEGLVLAKRPRHMRHGPRIADLR